MFPLFSALLCFDGSFVRRSQKPWSKDTYSKLGLLLTRPTHNPERPARSVIMERKANEMYKEQNTHWYNCQEKQGLGLSVVETSDPKASGGFKCSLMMGEC